VIAAGALLLAFQNPPTAPPEGFRDAFGGLSPVHRLAFEDRSRMALIRMPEGLWIAFNPATCAVQKVWRGVVAWRGKVFDFSQGNSQAEGDPLLEAPSVLASADGSGFGAGWTAEGAASAEGAFQFSDQGGIVGSPEIHSEGWSNIFAAYEETSRKGPFRFEVRSGEAVEQWFETTMHGSSEADWQWGMKLLEPKSSPFRLFVRQEPGLQKRLRRLRISGDRVPYWQAGRPIAARWRGFRIIDEDRPVIELHYDLLAQPTVSVKHTIEPSEGGWQERIEGGFPKSPPIMRELSTVAPSVRYRSASPELPPPLAARLNPGEAVLQPMPRRILWQEIR
jgi:hypothetical protein